MPRLLCLFAGASRPTGDYAAAFRSSRTGSGEGDSLRRPTAPAGARLDHWRRAPGYAITNFVSCCHYSTGWEWKCSWLPAPFGRFRPEWSSIPSLHLVVSIDGLASEHDRRRTPATYDRILKHIARHRIIVHCTVTRPMLARAGYSTISASSGRVGPKSAKSGSASILRSKATHLRSACGLMIEKNFSRSCRLRCDFQKCICPDW